MVSRKMRFATDYGAVSAAEAAHDFTTPPGFTDGEAASPSSVTVRMTGCGSPSCVASSSPQS